jgi:hypothetical protein
MLTTKCEHSRTYFTCNGTLLAALSSVGSLRGVRRLIAAFTLYDWLTCKVKPG